ncbi:MAG TPA: CBS domain-containing protein [Acidobacteriota bacterium]|nr:CBS domain-containing protein [Acidobacteriota bacterium]
MQDKGITESKIRHLQLDPPLCIESGTTVGQVLLRMRKEKQSCVLICRQERCVGIFTERDFLNKVLGRNVDMALTVDQFMSSNPQTLTIDDTVGEAIRLMHAHGYRNIPLVDQKGNCAGLVQIRNITQFLAELYPQEVLNARPPQQKFDEPDGA